MAFRADPFQNIVNVGWGGEDFVIAIHATYSVVAGNYTTGALQGGIGFQVEQFKLVDEEWVPSGDGELLHLNTIHEGAQSITLFVFPPANEEPYSEAWNIAEDFLGFGGFEFPLSRAKGRRIRLSAGGNQLQGVTISLRVAFWPNQEAFENMQQVNSPVGNFTVDLTGVESDPNDPGEFRIIAQPEVWIEFDFDPDNPAVTIFPFTP